MNPTVQAVVQAEAAPCGGLLLTEHSPPAST